MVSTIDIAPTILDFAGLGETYSMDGTSWKDAIDDDIVGDDWKANRCLFFESSLERAVRCGCYKYVELSDTSPEKLEAEDTGNNWWSGNEVLFNLCDTSGNYIVADRSTESPEITNIIADNQDLADDLRSVLNCHLSKTNANADPIYQECTLNGDPITSTPTAAPGPDAPVGPPELLSSTPSSNEAVSGDSVVINARVFDDDLRRVRIRVRLPDNTQNAFENMVQISSNGDEIDFEHTIDTTLKGRYSYKLELIDNSYPVVSIPSNGVWIDFLVAENEADVIDAARAELTTIIRSHPDNLAAKLIRLGFHDCVGGCDGCVDMLNGDNAGLDIPIEALHPVVDLYSHFGVTRADLWVLAALEAAHDVQQANVKRQFVMEWVGRPTCEALNSPCLDKDGNEVDCTEDRGPHRELPSPHLDTHGLLDYFKKEFDYQESWETVVIMGAHSLGTLSRANSGFNGPNGWLGNPNELDNAYYDRLVGGDAATPTDDFETLMRAADWGQVYVNNGAIGTPNRWQYERGVNPDHFVMVNADMAIVRDLSGYIDDDEGQVTGCQIRCTRQNGHGCALPRCPHAAETWDAAVEYKFDNDKFMKDFEVAFKKMLTTGATTSNGCANPPCVVPETGRRNLKKSYLRN